MTLRRAVTGYIDKTKEEEKRKRCIEIPMSSNWEFVQSSKEVKEE